MAQEMPPVATAPVPPAPTANAPAGPTAQPVSAAQLDQLVAPVALYPDALLGQVLMAATYPSEVAVAARWVGAPANRALTGAALAEALKAKEWDPSVLALVPFPRVLSEMGDRPDWTRRLGDAFLAQQADVMTAVQRLRHQAIAAGTLKTTSQCRCTVETRGDTVLIFPVNAELVSVPVYNPAVAYGDWTAPASPPAALPVPAGFAAAPATGLGFDPAIDLALYAPIWGWGSVDWRHSRIAVDDARYRLVAPAHQSFADGAWVHDPVHRRGLAYADPAVAARFGGAKVAVATIPESKPAARSGPKPAEPHVATTAPAPDARKQALARAAAAHPKHKDHVAANQKFRAMLRRLANRHDPRGVSPGRVVAAPEPPAPPDAGPAYGPPPPPPYYPAGPYGGPPHMAMGGPWGMYRR